MSTPPAQRSEQPGPLHERSQSQNNKPGIRIVPYSPPRISSARSGDGGASSQASSRGSLGFAAGHSSVGCNEGQEPGENKDASVDRVERDEVYAGKRGSALSAGLSPSLLLDEAQDERVSGAKPGTPSGNRGWSTPEASVRRTASEITLQAGTSKHGAGPLDSGRSSLPSRGRGRDCEEEGGSVTPTTPSTPGPAGPRPLSRRRNFVAVHADQTFTIVRQGRTSDASGTGRSSLKSPDPSYSSRSPSLHERPSTDTWTGSDSRPTSTYGSNTPTDTPLITLPHAPAPEASSSSIRQEPIASASTPSLWNYRMIGGLRKVFHTPDAKQKDPVRVPPLFLEGPPPQQLSQPATLAPLPEATVYRDETAADDTDKSPEIVPKASFASGQTGSTVSETTNYKVYGHSSPFERSTESLAIRVSETPNYEILGRSSPIDRASPSRPPRTAYSDQNIVLHGDPSPSPSSSQVALVRGVRPSYSQESLVIPPLRYVKKRSSTEQFGYYKQRSRESLRVRRAASIQSIKSFSSFLGQEGGQPLPAVPLFLDLGGASSFLPGRRGSGSETAQGLQQQPSRQAREPEQRQGRLPVSSWSSTQVLAGPSTRFPTTQIAPVPMVEAHPHVWSSQLSTVMSESEGGSEQVPSRPLSPFSSRNGGDEQQRRRGSTGWASSHSRQLQSISSSLVAQLDDTASGDLIERPLPPFARGARPSSSEHSIIRDHDESGDGLGALKSPPLSQRPSRSALSGFFSSSSGSRNLHSSGSTTSRANSLNAASIPAWARLYYGSGERRFLYAPSISTHGGDSRPSTSNFQGSASPDLDQFPVSIYSPRRRPHEVHPSARERPFSNQADVGVTERQRDYGVLRTLGRKTSSIWSPHLRMDRRATRYSIWEPPSVRWSANTGTMDKRNIQIVLFAVGFVFPFAWMTAALLSLPVNPKLPVTVGGENGNPTAEFPQKCRAVDEIRFESARWWRNLNRIMSLIGFIIIGLIVALVVVGMREGWTNRTLSSNT